MRKISLVLAIAFLLFGFIGAVLAAKLLVIMNVILSLLFITIYRKLPKNSTL